MSSDTEKLTQRNRELLILNAIAEALNREVDLVNALNATLAQVTELFELHTGWVWLLREDTGEIYVAAAQNLPPALADNPASLEGTCYCLDKYELGMMEGATNVSFITCTRLKNLVEGTDGLRYHASIPLYRRQRKVGVLNVARTNWQELSDDDLRLLSTIGDMLSIAIERAELFSQSTQLGAVEERNRLAREIHDTLAQGLTAITLQLETADALIDSNSDRARQAIQRALELARANLDEARRSVMDLRAAPLEDRTLPEAIAELLANCQTCENLSTEFEQIGGNRPLPVRLQVGLYRIAQEALNNVVRHANANHVRITLTVQPDEIELVIADDGDGFDPNQLPEGNRFGLIGLNERANLLGGHLNLCSLPNEGTTLRVVVPTSPEKQTHE